MPSAARAAAALGSGLVVLVAVTGCVSNAAPEATSTTGAARIAVTSSADACDLSTSTAPSGTLTFTVSNTGSDVTEFYLYAADGKQVVGEVENIGPGLSRDLVVTAKPGTYVAACKPGMAGDGIRHDVTVTDSGTPVPTTGARASSRPPRRSAVPPGVRSLPTAAGGPFRGEPLFA